MCYCTGEQVLNSQSNNLTNPRPNLHTHHCSIHYMQSLQLLPIAFEIEQHGAAFCWFRD